jgi:hypothetical protein
MNFIFRGNRTKHDIISIRNRALKQIQEFIRRSGISSKYIFKMRNKATTNISPIRKPTII